MIRVDCHIWFNWLQWRIHIFLGKGVGNVPMALLGSTKRDMIFLPLPFTPVILLFEDCNFGTESARLRSLNLFRYDVSKGAVILAVLPGSLVDIPARCSTSDREVEPLEFRCRLLLASQFFLILKRYRPWFFRTEC